MGINSEGSSTEGIGEGHTRCFRATKTAVVTTSEAAVRGGQSKRLPPSRGCAHNRNGTKAAENGSLGETGEAQQTIVFAVFSVV